MLFSFLSSSRFSALTAASVDPPAPVVVPEEAFAPDDCAVPRLLVPGAGAGELATPPADPAEPPVACANDTAGIAARAKITITVLIERAVGNLAIEISFAGQPPQPTPVPEQMPSHQLETGKAARSRSS